MNENSLKIGYWVDIAIGFSNNPQFATLPEGFRYVKYTCGFMVLSFLTKNLTSKQRWDLVEDYFLGHDEVVGKILGLEEQN